MNEQVPGEFSPDWPRIRHLLRLGILAAGMVLAGDMLLGFGVHDMSKSGLEQFLSMYLRLPDSTIFWSAFLGLIGIPIEVLCYFAVYRLIRPYSGKVAHLYRSGILGMLAFGGCGVHVPCLACVFFYKYMTDASPDMALRATLRFGLYFLLPGIVLFFVFWCVHHLAHITAFAKGLTPYPNWCWIFCPAVGMSLTMLLKFLPESALRNAITAGWMSIGSLWMFAGLLILSRAAESNAEKKK
ncbi:MAG: hypothetical protein IJ088_11755 [Clostridia bacterium]|nr:hypothetical protein [Clostridia bacterium]